MRLILVLGLIACGDKETTEEGTSVFDASNNDTDNVDGSGCPSVVPEEYRFLWDCENTSEDCSAKLYRYGVGESFEDGSFEVTEQWFLFNGPSDYCVDTFTITGQWDDRTPNTFGCADCEKMYEVYWDMQDSQCEVIWSSFFADQEASDPTAQSYYGFILLNTHGGWDIRSENMLVMASPVNGNQYAPNGNYGRGVATPTYEGAVPVGEADPMIDDIQPSTYVWTNTGDCLQ